MGPDTLGYGQPSGALCEPPVHPTKRGHRPFWLRSATGLVHSVNHQDIQQSAGVDPSAYI